MIIPGVGIEPILWQRRTHYQNNAMVNIDRGVGSTLMHNIRNNKRIPTLGVNVS